MRFINHRTNNIGVIGDYDAKKISHAATNEAIRHAAGYLDTNAKVTWLPTTSFLTKAGQERLEVYDAFWASPGSPYQSLEGAITAIRLVREMGKPFIGT